MSKAFSTNDAGSNINTSKNSDGTFNISKVTNGQQATVGSNPSLPANQTNNDPGIINFFGSSFSGTDIRLVAHLYRDNTSADKRRQALEADIELTQQVLEGYQLVLDKINTLSIGGPLGNNPAATSVGIAGAVSVLTNQRARRIVIDSVNSARVRSAPSLARLAIQKFKTSYQQLLQSQQEQLTAFNQIEYEAFDTVELGTLQTISIQSHREKYAVRALGHSYAKGYSRGPRTIAGSLIFTVFHEHAMRQLIYAMGQSSSFGDIDPEISTLIPDQLPPIDFTLVFANEYGQISEQRLYGVEFINDAVTYSIEDIFTEQVINYVARDVDVLTSRGRVRLSRLQRNHNGSPMLEDLNASELLFNNREYEKYLDKLSVRRRLRNR